MKITLLENSKIRYSGADRNNFILRGAELAMINYAEELSKLRHKITLINNCKKEIIYKGVNYRNINNINEKIITDFAIANSDANLFKYVVSKRNYILSHSIQSFEKFIRNKQLLPFFKYKPIVLCFSKYQYNKRSYSTSFFGKKLVIPSIDNDFFKTKLKVKNRKNVIFYSRSDRNLNILIDIWINKIASRNNNHKLYISADSKINKNLTKNSIIKIKYMNKRKLINFIKKFKILAIPGHKGEVFCNIAEECKALGIPIITMGIGALSERVQNNYNGFICRSYKEFAEKICVLLTNDKIYNRFVKNLRKDRGKNKWEDTVNNLIKIIR